MREPPLSPKAPADLLYCIRGMTYVRGNVPPANQRGNMKHEYAEKLWKCCLEQGRLGQSTDYDRGILCSLIGKAFGNSRPPHDFEQITGAMLYTTDWEQKYAPVIIGFIQMLTFDEAFDTLDLVDENYQEIVSRMGAPDASTIGFDVTDNGDGSVKVIAGGGDTFRIKCGSIRCLEVGDALVIAEYRQNGSFVLADGAHPLENDGFRKISVSAVPQFIDIDGKNSPVTIVHAYNGAKVYVKNI